MQSRMMATTTYRSLSSATLTNSSTSVCSSLHPTAIRCISSSSWSSTCPTSTSRSTASASRSLSSPFRPSSSVLLGHTFPNRIATPIMIGAGLVTAGLIANLLLGSKGAGTPASGKWIKGGFNAKMDKKEAAQILGLRETALTKAKVKEAHRRMMIANHPDRGGAPYLASSKLSPNFQHTQHQSVIPLPPHSHVQFLSLFATNRNQRGKRLARQNSLSLASTLTCPAPHTPPHSPYMPHDPVHLDKYSETHSTPFAALSHVTKTS